MSAEPLNTIFITKYNSFGAQKFYRFLLTYAINKLIKIRDGECPNMATSPELEFLDYSDRFLKSSRREGNSIYMEISKAFRKAAHKIYRILLKKGIIIKNNRFLNVV